MPLEKASAICQATKQRTEQCNRELARLRESHIEAEAFNEAARGFLQTAGWTPPGQFEELPPAPLSYLPVERSDDSGWNKRAEETRLFAEKATDASVRRELTAIAELYDVLAAAAPASASLAIGSTSPGIGAIAA